MEQLKLEKEKLMFLKSNLIKYLKSVDNKIKNAEQNIYDYCKNTTGHKIIREREDGPYGETFYYCELCGYEKY
jgi:hypothetical protein